MPCLLLFLYAFPGFLSKSDGSGQVYLFWSEIKFSIFFLENVFLFSHNSPTYHHWLHFSFLSYSLLSTCTILLFQESSLNFFFFFMCISRQLYPILWLEILFMNNYLPKSYFPFWSPSHSLDNYINLLLVMFWDSLFGILALLRWKWEISNS